MRQLRISSPIAIVLSKRSEESPEEPVNGYRDAIIQASCSMRATPTRRRGRNCAGLMRLVPSDRICLF